MGILRKGTVCLLAFIMAMSMAPLSTFADTTGSNTNGNSAVADPGTITSSDSALTENNIGRVWTDKTVSAEDITVEGKTAAKGDSDFLVGLSALSSTAKTDGTSTVPLDIVLVLDTSGSMADSMQDEYTKVYSSDLDKNKEYFILLNGQYQSVSYQNGSWGYWTGYGYGRWKYVTPKTSASDSENTQFYGKYSKLMALQNAANQFIDDTLAANQGSDVTNRIGIVTFASESSIKNNLTEVSTSGAATLKKTISGLRADGATRADYGMSSATEALRSARSDAKKVVVFFTDGEPTKHSEFDDNVAQSAVSTARNLKGNDTTIYSVGVFKDANPQDTRGKFNAYMHAVSSNYKTASYTHQGWSWTWNLGDRTKKSDGTDSQFYMAATNASELNQIFEDIAKEITTQDPTSPTKVDGDDLSKSGYVTFTDQLGDYMQVDEFKSLVWNGTEFKNVSKTTSGNTDTYTFQGKTHNILSNDDIELSNILITVERSNDLKTGDKVTVKVPAGLIPLQYYEVSTSNGKQTKELKQDASPLHLFYGVSLKDGVDSKLANPDDAMQAYLEKNTEDGKVSFYSNAYEKNSDAGKTTAKFTPATENRYYGSDYSEAAVAKTDNTTKTATKAVVTTKDNSNIVAALGNNGRLTTDLPGELAITKTVTGIDESADDFTFEVETTDGIYVTKTTGGSGTVTNTIEIKNGKGTATLKAGETLHIYGIPAGASYTVSEKNLPDGYTQTAPVNADQEPVSAAGTITAGGTSKAKFTNHYQADPVTVDTTAKAPLNKVVSHADWEEGQTFSFQIEAVTKDAPMPKNKTVEVSKPEKGNSAEFGFGDITFTKAGTYQYTIKEVKGSIAGMEYSDSVATLTITVVDGGKGKLEVAKDGIVLSNDTFTNTYRKPAEGSVAINVTKEMKGRKLKAGEFTFSLHYRDGTAVTGLLVKNGADGSVDFGNLSYTTEFLQDLVDTQKATMSGPDKDGNITYMIEYSAMEDTEKLPEGVTATKDAIHFTVKVVDDGKSGKLTAKAIYPDMGDGKKFVNTYATKSVDISLNGTKVLKSEDGLNPGDITGKFTFTATGKDGAPMPEKKQTTNDASGSVDFGNISYTLDDLKDVEPNEQNERVKTFEYSIKESGSVAGVTNDSGTKTVKIQLKDDGKGHLTATRVSDGDSAFTFTNTYKVEPKQYSVTKAISMKKDLTGKDLKDGEFTFEQVEQKDGNENVVATGTNDKDGNISLGTVTYTKPGVYSYTVREKTGKNPGITYDQMTYQVVVYVTDNGDGTLSAEVEGPEKVIFNNTYEAKSTDVSVTAKKELKGSTLKDGQFTFQMKDEDGKVISTVKNAANGKVVFDGLTFSKAGEYKYTISEVNDKQQNITYDTDSQDITVTVSDDGSGQLKATVKGAGTFHNTYKVEKKSIAKLIRTGDDSQILLLAGVTVLALLGLGIVTYVRKKKNI